MISTWLSVNDRIGSDDWIIGRRNARSVKRSFEGANILTDWRTTRRRKKEREVFQCQSNAHYFIQLLWEPNSEEKPDRLLLHVLHQLKVWSLESTSDIYHCCGSDDFVFRFFSSFFCESIDTPRSDTETMRPTARFLEKFFLNLDIESGRAYQSSLFVEVRSGNDTVE